jgi:hypothetical protein
MAAENLLTISIKCQYPNEDPEIWNVVLAKLVLYCALIFKN